MENGFPNYEDMADETLIRLIRGGNTNAQDFLIDKYKNFVKMKTRFYFIIGADKEDIIQEGMIGLYKAIRDYEPDKKTSFYAFAELCVNRQIISAIKAATRQKHIPLNSYLSLDNALYDDNAEKTHIDMLSENRISSPEELFINKENKLNIEAQMERVLSSFERKVLSLYLHGKSYAEIGANVQKDEKAVDNALQRVRRKLEKIK